MARFPAASLNAAGNAVLVAGTTYYTSVHSADPGPTGASELASSTRQATVFTTWASGATGNTALIAVPNPGTVAATYVGFWTLASGGTYLGGMLMAGPVTAASITFAIGALAPNVTG